MTKPTHRRTLLRPRDGEAGNRVTFVELFFDLVFVFAVTQLSHLLLHHLSLRGAAETGLLFLAVWWAWIDTSWVTNWLDPRRMMVRRLLFVLMFAGLVLSTSIPEAFGSRGLALAGAYVFMQVGRSLFMLWAVAGDSDRNFRNFERIISWQVVAGVFWIVGGLGQGTTRLVAWTIAVAIETLGPVAGFWVPGLGTSTTRDWDISGDHMAERCGLFIIIALGESILVSGATFTDLEWTWPVVGAFVSTFIGSVAMWWIYFNIGAERAGHAISSSSDPGRMGRLAYTYFHLPIVAGIIVVAVADELVLTHTTGHVSLSFVTVTLGGPALYLAGNILFKRTVAARTPLSHLIGLAMLAMTLLISPAASPLLLQGMTMLILVIVSIWETMSLAAYAPEL
jgi:low temperature requirement protein LtrA